MEEACISGLGWKVAKYGDVLTKKGVGKVQVLHRFAFSSALKRMSTIALVELQGAPPPPLSSRFFIVAVKGAPGLFFIIHILWMSNIFQN